MWALNKYNSFGTKDKETPNHFMQIYNLENQMYNKKVYHKIIDMHKEI